MSVTTTTTEVVSNRAWEVPPNIGARRTRPLPSRARWRWPAPIALLAWAVYSASAIWMTESLHLQIGDSIARMTDARAMLFSRDPHLAAIGLYWMPLPTAGQLPFMLLLSPLHHAELSGPLACAFIGCLTVLVMARICWFVGLSKPVGIAFTLVYAFNPLVVYTNGNGMSESWLFLALSLAALGFLRWTSRHRAIDLAVLGGALALVALVRYEGFVLAPVMALIAAINDGRTPPRIDSLQGFLLDVRSRVRRWLTTASMIVAPTAFVLALWMLMNYVIARDPLNWYKLQRATGHTTPSAYGYLPSPHLLPILGYVIGMILAVTPALLVITPPLLLRRRYHEFLTSFGLLAGALVWPVIVIIGIFLSDSAGAPRYFEPSIVFVTVGAIWLTTTATPRWRLLRRATPYGLIALLILCLTAGTIGMENPRRTSIEQENHFFSAVLGHHLSPLPDSALSHSRSWRALAAALDKELTPGHKVLVDVSDANFGAFVYTRHPGRYIVNSDRDYGRIVADPIGKFDYMIIPKSLAAGGQPGKEYPQLETILTTTTGGHWVQRMDYFVGTVYQWAPDLAGPA